MLSVGTCIHFLSNSCSGEDLISDASAGKDQPLFCLKKHDQMTYDVGIMTMHYAEEVLRAAGDKKMHEVRACLEGLSILLIEFLCYMTY